MRAGRSLVTPPRNVERNVMSDDLIPSIRGEVPQVKDLKAKMEEIMLEEFEGLGIHMEPEIERAVARIYDAVTQTAMLDPHS